MKNNIQSKTNKNPGQRDLAFALSHLTCAGDLLDEGAKMTKTSFREATKLANIWNKVIEWNGLKLATVLWHYKKEWKLVDTLEFTLVNDRDDKTHIIAEFHTQEELWRYIKENKLDTNQ